LPYGKKLRQVLRERDLALENRLSEIEKTAKSVLTYTAGAFPYYTPHDFLHSSNVEENLNWLIPDGVKHDLNEWEIFFLIVAAWFHDWGMVCRSTEDPREVREVHHRRTEGNFENMYESLGLNANQARIIGRISRGHRVEDLRSNLFDRQIYSSDIHIDVRFLAAILRLADECDITHSRVPEIIYHSLSPQGVSEEHFRSHLLIGGIGKYVEHKIEISAVAYDPRASQTLIKVRDRIQREVDHVKGILAERGIPIEYVELHVDARGFIDKPIGFRLDEKKVTQLLVGEHLYSRKDVAIRELLQNAFDACRSRGDDSAEIRIYVNGDKLVVQDNGIGIDFENAYNFLAQKGFSYYQSDEFKRTAQASSFDPVSRWGLGILSCFLIASEMCIETKKKDKESCKFLITGVAEGWRYEEGSLREPGTIITLTLNETGKKIDLETVLRHYVKSCPVPIYLGKDSDRPLEFDWSAADPDIQEAMSEHSGDRGWEIKWEDKFEDDEISVRYYRTTGISGIFIANQGFFVGEFDEVDPFFPSSITGIALVNSKREIFDVDISREKIMTNTENYALFREKWIQVCIAFMNDELAEKLRSSTKKDEITEFLEYNSALNRYDLSLITKSDEIEKEELATIPESLKDLELTTVPYFVLTRDGLAKRHLIDLASFMPQRTILYDFVANTYENIRTETRFLNSVLCEKLGAKDIVLALRIPFLTFQKGRLEEMLSFLLDNTGELTYLHITDVVRGLRFDEVKTDLDLLLPQNSHFCRLPSDLRGAVVFTEPFKVKTPRARFEFPEEFSRIQKILPSFDTRGESPERERRENLAPYFTHVLLGCNTPKLELVEAGHLIFDFEDEFNQIILRDYELINKETDLQDAVRNYFLQLVAFFIVPNSLTADHLNIKESEICARLKHAKPQPMAARLGDVSRALLSMGAMYFSPYMNSEYFVINLQKEDAS
jgi:hypothetical protein